MLPPVLLGSSWVNEEELQSVYSVNSLYVLFREWIFKGIFVFMCVSVCHSTYAEDSLQVSFLTFPPCLRWGFLFCVSVKWEAPVPFLLPSRGMPRIEVTLMWGLGICKHGKCFHPLDHLPNHLGVDILFIYLFVLHSWDMVLVRPWQTWNWIHRLGWPRTHGDPFTSVRGMCHHVLLVSILEDFVLTSCRPVVLLAIEAEAGGFYHPQIKS